MKCRMCAATANGDLCRFCERTVELIKSGRCVTCTEPIARVDDARIEGRCVECRVRNVRLGSATKHLLGLAARARYRAERAA